MRIVILGGTGMLGSAVVSAFASLPTEVYVSSRVPLENLPKNHTAFEFDAERSDLVTALGMLAEGDVLVNCIGIIKTEINERDASSLARAENVNSKFPAKLALLAEQRGFNVLQIATDCVFSGSHGPSDEGAIHDPEDWYGKTKSAGEIRSRRMMHLRVSIIGREIRGFTSLYEWVSRQASNSSITGYSNHYWNGVPADHFGLIARGIIERQLFRAGTYHLVPGDWVTKGELVQMIANHEGRADIEIAQGPGPKAIDRRLATRFSELNRELWAAAGYKDIPTISQLVNEI